LPALNLKLTNANPDIAGIFNRAYKTHLKKNMTDWEITTAIGVYQELLSMD
jgi:hypothetical protein